MLQILDRAGIVIKTLDSFAWSEWKYEDVNEITIEGNPEEFLQKIVKLYDGNDLVGTGIVQSYEFDKNSNHWNLIVYPLIYDLSQWFLENEQGRVVYYNDDLANVIQDIINKYRASVSNPIVFIKTKRLTGIRVRHSFSYKTWYEAFKILANELIHGDNFISLSPDGGIEIRNARTTHDLSYKSDIMHISYKKYADEIINFIEFDNWKPWDGRIKKIYQDIESINLYGKRVKFIRDERFKHIESADAFIANFFEKNAGPKISIESLKTQKKNIQMYDTISIHNWEKSFDDGLVVVGITRWKNGIFDLKVGTDFRRSEYEIQDEYNDSSDTISYVNDSINANNTEINGKISAVDWRVTNINNDLWNRITIAKSEALSEGKTYTDGKIASIPRYTPPSYIKETFIDSVEVKAPVLSWNQGKISWNLIVGDTNGGIVIDGVNKRIHSSNFSSWSTGWMIKNDGGAEFNNAAFRGNILAGTININNNFTVASNWDVRWNNLTNKTINFENLAANPTYSDGRLWCDDWIAGKKVLWWFFGGEQTRQQISMSWMQKSVQFDFTSGLIESVVTWFKPRLVICQAYISNEWLGKHVTSSWQAWVAENEWWKCTIMQHDWFQKTTIPYISDIAVNSNWAVTSISRWSFVDNIPITYFWFHSWNLASNKDGTAYVRIKTWKNTGVDITVMAGNWWRIQWICTIIW